MEFVFVFMIQVCVFIIPHHNQSSLYFYYTNADLANLHANTPSLLSAKGCRLFFDHFVESYLLNLNVCVRLQQLRRRR